MESSAPTLDDGQVEGIIETPLIVRTSVSISANHLDADTTPLPSLSKPLLLLYGFNGITLAFPMLALMYIVNTRVAMPLSDLSIYGALAFCPFSLKPLYAYLSSSKQHRHVWITTLLLLNGFCNAATALIPSSHDNENAIMWCFLLALIRGITCAWPEFLLGSTLIDVATAASWESNTNASQTSTGCLEQIVARFQSQAATARNLGSLLANVGVILVLFLHQKLRATAELNDGLVTTMLVVTGAWSLVGATLAGMCRVGSSQRWVEHRRQLVDGNVDDDSSARQGYNETTNHNDLMENTFLFRGENNQDHNQLEHAQSTTFCCKNRSKGGADVLLIVTLQIALILLVLRAPLSDWLQPHPRKNDRDSTWTGVVITGVILLTVATFAIMSVFCCCRKQATQHLHSAIETQCSKEQMEQQVQRYRVGLFLILRHAMPSCSDVMSSFFYFMFQATPWVLQLFSLTEMATITLASWSYGRLLAPHSHGWKFLMVLAGTTLISSVSELLFLVVTPRHIQDPPSLVLIFVVILVKVMVTFCNEWQFLPNVVLATSYAAATSKRTRSYCDGEEHPADASLAAAVGLHQTPSSGHGSEQKTFEHQPCGPDDGTRHQAIPISGRHEPNSSNQPQLWYGTLISCIDFGGQIGSWITVPLVSALNITRENDWDHLHVLIELSSVFGITTLILLILLQPPRWIAS
jgi:hypothetical protein